MYLAILGDIHGGLDTLRKAISYLANIDLDLILCTGDYIESFSADVSQSLEILFKIFDYLNSLDRVIAYTWGDADLVLFNTITHSSNVELNHHNLNRILNYILNMRKTFEAPRKNRLCLENRLCITSNPNYVNSKTILLIHYMHTVARNPLLHIEGHTHYAQIKDNYINAGFIYCKDSNSGKVLNELVIIVELDEMNYIVKNVAYRFLDIVLKEYTCFLHREEGVFIIPKWWKRCPVCMNPLYAKFSNIYQGIRLVEQL